MGGQGPCKVPDGDIHIIDRLDQKDDPGIQRRKAIGAANMLRGADFPHADSRWQTSRDVLPRLVTAVPERDLRKATSENAARRFGFALD